jgi:hypothetical protein
MWFESPSCWSCVLKVPVNLFAVTSSAGRGVRLDAHLVVDGVHDPLPGAVTPGGSGSPYPRLGPSVQTRQYLPTLNKV